MIKASSVFEVKISFKRKNHKNCIRNYRMDKKQLESFVNIISKKQNPAITFINRHTYPCKIKT